MNRKNWFLVGLLGCMLILSLVFSCDLGEEDQNKEEPPGPAPVLSIAERPVISDLASNNYVVNDAAEALSVKVTPVESGELTYQWYSNTVLIATPETEQYTEITGEVEPSFMPPTTAVGDTYYYVVVTNTDETKTDIPVSARTSNIARIRVVATAEAIAPNATITVDTATRYQYIRGFGGMSNVWTSPALVADDIDKLYSEDGLGLNIFRICIYPYHADLFDGTERGPGDDPNAHRRYYEMVRQAKSLGALILASPWTPPSEWKDNGSRLGGGHLLRNRWANYAQHLTTYIRTMAENGAAIDYISIQNEPDIGVSYDGCDWSPEDMRDFVKDYARVIAPEGDPVKIMPGESFQYRDVMYRPTYNDAEALSKVDLIGGHIYGGGLNRKDWAIDADKEVWMTEHLFNTEGNYPIDSQWQSVWVVAQEIHDCMVADFNAYIWWYLKRFYSMIGDGESGTLNGQLLYRGYALSHYAKYATGKTRVAASLAPANTNVLITAYESDSEITVVLFNRSNADIGQLNIDLPVAATGASMVITQGTSNTDTTNGKKMDPDIVVLSADKMTGTLDLPASSIISVRFSK